MTTASITKDQAKRLYDFCIENKCENIFFSNDNGAYFGASTGSHKAGTFKNNIQYLKGCHPDKDEFYYENTGDKFGYNDFGDNIPVEWLKVFFTDSRFAKKRMFSIRINQSSMSLVA